MIDHLGRHVADREFDASGAGYGQFVAWLASFGCPVAVVGVEGTGAYGAELARVLRHWPHGGRGRPARP